MTEQPAQLVLKRRLGSALVRYLPTLKLSYVLAIAGFVIVAAGAILTAFFISSLRDSELKAIRNRLEIPAQAVAQFAKATGRSANLVLLDIQEAAEAQDGRITALPSLREMLVERDHTSELIRAIVIYDTEGKPIVTSLSTPLPASTVADYNFFRRQIAVRSNQMKISELIADPLDGRPTVAASRPLLDRRGTVRGVIAVYFDTEQLQESLNSLQMPAGTTLTLFNLEGRQLVRTPAIKLSDRALEIDFSKQPPFRNFLDHKPDSVFVEFTNVTGQRRFYAHAGGIDTGFVVVAGWNAGIALSPWRNAAMVIGGGTFAAVLVIVGLLLSAMREISRGQARDLALRQSREDLARAQQVAGIGSFSRDIATGRVEWSDECLRIWGISGEPSQTAIEFLTNLVHPEDRQSFIESREAVLQGKPARSQDFRIIRRDGEERTVHHEYSADFDENGKPVRLFGTIQDITERKRIELELRHSREDLARAQQVARIGSFSRDIARGRIEWSDEFLRIWGLTGMAGKTTVEALVLLIHPEDRQKFLEGRDAAVDTGARMPLDFRITRPDGEERVLHREYGVIFDHDKKPIRMFGTVQDITERKKIENEMRHSREDLARAQRIAGIGSFERDLITGETKFSDEFYRIHGVVRGSPQSTIEFLRSLVHPEDRDRIDEFRNAAETGTPMQPIDYRIIRPDGVERVLHRESEILADENGRRIFLSGTLQDVTERKRVELEMRRSRENLARAQRLAGIGSFERDFVTNEAEWSDEMYHIVGIEKADTFSGSETLLKLVHPDDREKFVESRSAELKGEPLAPIEYRIIRPDGAERVVRRESAIIFDEEKRPVRRYGTLQDITELRLAERRERELERQLLHSQKLEALGTLAGGIAHDLNNTLVPIMALSKLTARRFEAGSLVRANLETIYEASERARDLVKRVVAFSRKDESEMRNANIAGTVTEALKLLRATIPSSITLEARIGEVPPIPADMTQIHQVVTNLVANASQALGREIGTITVTLDVLSGLSGQPEICLSVSDTGIGMDEATQQRIFEPFFTTKAVGEGTGLGLSIVHNIVVSHGGRIEVKSEPGKGTRFDLHFPIPVAGAPAAVGEITSSRPAA